MKIYTYITARLDIPLEEALVKNPEMTSWIDEDKNIVRLSKGFKSADFEWTPVPSPIPNTHSWMGTMEVDDVPS